MRAPLVNPSEICINKLTKLARQMARVPIEPEPSAPVNAGFEVAAGSQHDMGDCGAANPALDCRGLGKTMPMEAKSGMKTIAPRVNCQCETKQADERSVPASSEEFIHNKDKLTDGVKSARIIFNFLFLNKKPAPPSKCGLNI